MTREKVVAALDKPRSTYSVLGIVNPGGDVDVVQTLLMRMREEGLVKFDIKKGLWSRATQPAETVLLPMEQPYVAHRINSTLPTRYRFPAVGKDDDTT
jgi:hypothetical protein